MKVFSSSIFALFLLSCGVSKTKSNETNDLIGKITVSELIKTEHKEWFNKELNTYKVDIETLSDFENNPNRLKKISVKIFLGTWCSDSRREVPRFYNVLRFLNIENFELIGLNRKKKSPTHLEKGMNINYVPTFIIYLDGKEINRIIETPVESLEKDLIAIIQAKNYTPNYQD